MTDRITVSERIVRLETLMTQAITEIQGLREDLKVVRETFVTKESSSKDITDLQEQINELRNKRWVHNTLSAILGSILTVLIGYLLANIFGRT